MYAEFLQAVLAYVQALNAAAKDIVEMEDMTPYVNHIPVLLSDELSGFLIDEIGGVYSYREADENDRAWWAMRPWAK